LTSIPGVVCAVLLCTISSSKNRQVRDSLCRTDVGWVYSLKNIWRNAGIKRSCAGLPLMCVSEERLVPASFEELAMPLLDRLYNFAHWLTRNREEAEDLVQETFAKALKGFSSFQPGTNSRAWIYRILRNTFLTSRTGLKSAATVPLDAEGGNDALPATQRTPESILLERLDQQLAREALDQPLRRGDRRN
jgi:RNA polymerase sigma factor (sigma-70 family)